MNQDLLPVISEAVRAFAIIILPCVGSVVITGLLFSVLQAVTTVREEGMVFAAKMLALLVTIAVLYPTFSTALQSVYRSALQ